METGVAEESPRDTEFVMVRFTSGLTEFIARRAVHIAVARGTNDLYREKD